MRNSRTFPIFRLILPTENTTCWVSLSDRASSYGWRADTCDTAHSIFQNASIMSTPTRSLGRLRTSCSQKNSSRHIRSRRNLTSRSEEHPSELQSLMRTSYAVLFLNKNNHPTPTHSPHTPH